MYFYVCVYLYFVCVFIRSPSVSFLVKMPQAFNEVVNRVCDLLSGHSLPSKSFVMHCSFKKLVGINFFSDRSNHQSLVIYAIMRNVSVKILSDFSIISQRIHSTVLHNLRSVTHLEEREEGFEGDASIGASLAVRGLHQLLHVTLRRVLAQRA